MKPLRRVLLSSLLAISLATEGSRVHAEMLRTDSAVSAPRDRILEAVQRPEIRARLAAQGVDAREVEARVAALTDEEATLLASKFDELPAGGDGRALLAAVTVFVIVYVVIKLLPLILAGGAVLLVAKASKSAGAGNG